MGAQLESGSVPLKRSAGKGSASRESTGKGSASHQSRSVLLKKRAWISSFEEESLGK